MKYLKLMILAVIATFTVSAAEAQVSVRIGARPHHYYHHRRVVVVHHRYDRWHHRY